MGKWRETPPSGLDAQRQLLDQLMGLNRNLDNPDAEVKTFKDERVCKHFLAGLCPHDLFSNTKMDMGLCDKIHEDKLKEEYDEKVAKGRSYGYDEELERTLDDFVNEVDRKIQRSQKRLEEDGEGAVKVNAESGAEIIRLTGEINEAMKEAEKAGEEGDIDVAQELMTKVETLKQQKSETQAKMLRESSAVAMVAPGQNPDASVVGALTSTDVNQKLRVCDVCGAFLSIYDSDSRLADHFGGKLHMGFVQIRAKLKDIRETRVKRREEQEEKRNASRREGRDREHSSRSRGGHRSRSRDGKPRADRDRDRRSSHKSDRDRDRGRDRRDRDRSHRDRGRSRERDRRRR
mmetsp:Transcript_21712/g.28108  ORF Transcript_21712/g.28108 Transcript_21712/m.28108 type:complete len:347 (-) Transcript_21712:186-1226(-)